MNTVLQYITKNDELHLNSLSTAIEDILPNTEGIKEYVEVYAAERGISDIESFQINPEAAKSVKRKARAILKLDNAIEIRISPSCSNAQQVIERGYDAQKGMSFYKVFFKEEQ